jgi:aryl-alcohol dehydrogenase-like predicted oxidoreductase
MAFAPRVLGRTGITVGPLGLSASYGLGGADLEWGLDHGCNYLYWGSLRRGAFGAGLRDLCARRRDEVCLVVQSYSRAGFLVKLSVERALRRLGADHADVVLLGMWQGRPWSGVLEAAQRLREEGKTRFLGVTSHHRPFVGALLADPATPFDVVHVRYNAAHRGAEREVFPLRTPGGPGVVSFTSTRWGSLLKRRKGEPRTPTAGDCYRFVLSHPAVDLCMTGPRNGDDLRAAVAGLEEGRMDEEEARWMRAVGDRVYSIAMGR